MTARRRGSPAGTNPMLTYEKALTLIRNVTPSPRVALTLLQKAWGCVLAADVTAPCDLPSFDNSAVDGYALRLRGAAPATALRLIGTAEAGRPFRGIVRAGEAVRIFTGASVPRGAQAVVMQEHVIRTTDTILLKRAPISGQHIRRRGEDIRRRTTVLRAGRTVRAQELGLLAALGLRAVRIHRRPTVAILTTGNELRPAGTRLAPGQIYDSNGPLLNALVHEAGGCVLTSERTDDRLQAITAKIRQGLAADVLLIAGGCSIGDKDFVRAALARCGVRPVFWRVNIKPGMPLFCGRRGRTVVFGLPGNPVSVFVTFREFVRPALTQLRGLTWRDGYRTPATLAHDLRVSATRRTHFVRVAATGSNGTLRVRALEGQGAHHLRSLVEADGWMRLSSEDGPWAAGASVLVQPEGAT